MLHKKESKSPENKATAGQAQPGFHMNYSGRQDMLGDREVWTRTGLISINQEYINAGQCLNVFAVATKL